MESNNNKEESQVKKSPKRTRKSNGQFAKTTEIESGLEKKVDITVKKKVSAPSNAEESAGKYAPQEKVVPSFGTVKTTLH